MHLKLEIDQTLIKDRISASRNKRCTNKQLMRCVETVAIHSEHPKKWQTYIHTCIQSVGRMTSFWISDQGTHQVRCIQVIKSTKKVNVSSFVTLQLTAKVPWKLSSGCVEKTPTSLKSWRKLKTLTMSRRRAHPVQRLSCSTRATCGHCSSLLDWCSSSKWVASMLSCSIQ